MPLPDRNTIKADLVSLIRDNGTVTPSEAYVALASAWGLSVAERDVNRSGRRLYEHEIRWARQELVIEGVLDTTDAAGKGAWRLKSSSPDEGSHLANSALGRMIEGFLEPGSWFMDQWLPNYERTIDAARRAIAQDEVATAVDLVWQQQDNSVSHAGQGVLAASQIETHREFFHSLTQEIVREPSPSVFDSILARARQARDEFGLSKVPHLLLRIP